MAFTENLNAFLNADEFAVAVSSGAISGLGILNMPDEVVAGGYVMSTDYTVLCKASEFGSLATGASVDVAGVTYTLKREPMLQDDGAFVELMLQKD